MATKARALDRDMPVTIDLHPDCEAFGWHVAVEAPFASLPNTVVWDGPAWDAATRFWDQGSSWVDLVGDVRGWSMEIGRRTIDGHMLAATVEIDLDNSSGRYTQFEVDSSGDLIQSFFLPGRGLAIWRELGGVIYPRFFGRVEIWEENLETAEGEGPMVKISGVDGFEKLNTGLDSLSYVMGREADLPINRISNLLDFASFPATARRLAVGDVLLRSLPTSNPILEELHHTADADGGVCFIDVDGTFWYRDRTHATVGRSTIDQAAVPVFSDRCTPGTYDFSAGDPLVDLDGVVNVVRLTNVDGTTVRLEDAASLAKYGLRALPGNTTDGMLWTWPGEGNYLAQFILDLRADLYYRYDVLTIYGRLDNGLLPVLLNTRVGDRIEIERTFTDGDVIRTPLIVEGMALNVVASDPSTRFDLFVSKAGT